MKWAYLVVAVGLVGAPVPSQPVSTIGQAIAEGQAGERFDGYMDAIGSASPGVRREISAINIRRRNLYLELAQRRNVTADLVGMATACQLLAELSPGEAYMLNDRVWRRHSGPEPIPVPNYCR